jgi:hypothetical protein
MSTHLNAIINPSHNARRPYVSDHEPCPPQEESMSSTLAERYSATRPVEHDDERAEHETEDDRRYEQPDHPVAPDYPLERVVINRKRGEASA